MGESWRRLRERWRGTARERRFLVVWCLVVLLPRFAAAGEPLYQEPLRPQFHFAAARNWLNDPNGLVYFAGEYHLFFQSNPHGNEWGNMTWGHASSDDLVHWRQLGDAIEPDAMGTIFSGSCVVDGQNTAGFQTGDDPALVAIYTAAGGTSPQSAGAKFTQCLAYSNDRGRTWTKYAGNPVLPHVVGQNRDPKVIWHAPSRRWVMALYLDGNEFALFNSPDLKHWTRTDEFEVPGSIECPDMFEMNVEQHPQESKWLFWTANNAYLVGDFDGKKFTPRSGPQRFEFGANRFAAQSFSNIPARDGRRIQIAWMRGGSYPGMPFNQQLTFPTELTLHATNDGYELHSQPVHELATLRGKPLRWSGSLDGEANPVATLAGDLYEFELVVAPGKATEVVLELRGVRVSYDAAAGTLRCGESAASVPLLNGVLKLHVLVDRTSVEVFANDGAVTFSNCFLPAGDPQYALRGDGGHVESLVVWPLRSAWETRER